MDEPRSYVLLLTEDELRMLSEYLRDKIHTHEVLDNIEEQVEITIAGIEQDQRERSKQ